MELVIKSIDMGNCFKFLSRRDVEQRTHKPLSSGSVGAMFCPVCSSAVGSTIFLTYLHIPIK